MKLKKFTLLVGLNDKDTKKQLITIKQAKKIVIDTCGDCTISKANGHYTHEDGTKVTENTLRIELLFKADNEVLSMCKKLKKELNQESIALSYSYENSVLV
ncbi:MAG: hypothetical protein IIZ67_02330 [Bacilli bacterium]|nr:hypothetical protein [Bacilli bacterium]